MPRCPNCYYLLVLLEKRRRYKCSKCGRVFLKKEIDDKDFREWNKKQRKIDKENIKRPKRVKTSQETKMALKPRGRPKSKFSLEEQREKRLKQKHEWRIKNHEKIKRWRKDKSNQKKLSLAQEKYRQVNKDRVQMNKRLCYWRMKQKNLIPIC